jgi:DNA-binding transcriptional ArsR family regulator
MPEKAREDRVYRVTDPEALRALAHALRGRLLYELRTNGPATASELGRRLGESSGATSYHLRILARYGFVEDDPDHAHGRERWWRSAHDLTYWDPADFEGQPGEREAAAEFLARVSADYARQFAAWLHEMHEWPREWQSATTSSDRLLTLDAKQLDELSRELEALLGRYAELEPGEGSEHVHAIVQTFPRPRTERP